MRAQIKEILPSDCPPAPITLVVSPMEPIYVQHRQASKKYKKVGKEAKQKLLQCIQKGWSIINVAKKFGINYSTAKSIVQNHKKKHGSVEDNASEPRLTSTDSCESHSQLISIP